MLEDTLSKLKATINSEDGAGDWMDYLEMVTQDTEQERRGGVVS